MDNSRQAARLTPTPRRRRHRRTFERVRRGHRQRRPGRSDFFGDENDEEGKQSNAALGTLATSREHAFACSQGRRVGDSGDESALGTVPSADHRRSGSVNTDHVPDRRPTERTVTAALAAPLLLGTGVTHAHVSAHVEDAIDAPLIADRTFAGLS